MKKKRISVVITAAGIGKRMGLKTKKQYLFLQGYPVLYHTVKKFILFKPAFTDIVLTVPPDDISKIKKSFIQKYGFDKIHIVPGGETRHHSVYNGIEFLSQTAPDYVLIHDGVRPFISHNLIKKLIDNILAAILCSGIIPGLKISDTVKKISEKGFIRKTVDRNSLITVQTPQIFKFKLLYDCYKKTLHNLNKFTDDASILEHYNKRIKYVNGSRYNIKITAPADMKAAKKIGCEL